MIDVMCSKNQKVRVQNTNYESFFEIFILGEPVLIRRSARFFFHKSLITKYSQSGKVSIWKPRFINS